MIILNDFPHVVSVSFGQTSGRMLRLLMDEMSKTFDEEATVLFCNTGQEHPKTLKFGKRIEKEWGVKIVWLEYHRVLAAHVSADYFPEGRRRALHIKKQDAGETCHWFKVVNFDTAKRPGDKETPFDELLEWMSVLPNTIMRACSAELKIRTMRRYLWSIGKHWVNDNIGIRVDESHRAIEIRERADEFYRVPQFPLIEQKITKEDVDKWWNEQPFKLEVPNHEGNCQLCMLKAKWKRISILRRSPEIAKWWMDWETKRENVGRGGQWDKTNSVRSLLNAAQHPEFDLGNCDNEPDIACSCAVGGKEYKDPEGE